MLCNVDSPIIDSLEFVDQEYVFVSGHAEGSSSSTSASLQRNLPAKYENPSVSPPNLAAPSAPMPINGTAINRQQSAGTGSLDSHCSPISGTSQGSAYLSDGLDQPPSDYLTRIRLLGQYASTIAELVKEEVNLYALMTLSSVSLLSFLILLYFVSSQLFEMLELFVQMFVCFSYRGKLLCFSITLVCLK